MIYRGCIVHGGKQIVDVSSDLYSDESQILFFRPRKQNTELISGTCYYMIPITNTSHAILELVFYRNIYGREYYGMLNNAIYNVSIQIMRPGYAVYRIY